MKAERLDGSLGNAGAGMLRADVAVCWTTEYVYNIMILSSFFYLWKGNWRNKKI